MFNELTGASFAELLKFLGSNSNMLSGFPKVAVMFLPDIFLAKLNAIIMYQLQNASIKFISVFCYTT